jgi:hypothetical protein
VTAHPNAEWLARELTDACGWDEPPRYLIRDRDGAYGLPSSSASGPWAFATDRLGSVALAERICGEADRHDPTVLITLVPPLNSVAALTHARSLLDFFRIVRSKPDDYIAFHYRVRPGHQSVQGPLQDHSREEISRFEHCLPADLKTMLRCNTKPVGHA